MRRRLLVALGCASLLFGEGLVAQPQWLQAKKQEAEGFVAMAYDAARERVVEVAGDGYSPCVTREWDGTRWLLRAPAQRPSPRTGHALAYDSARRRVVLFGGRAFTKTIASGYLADVWEWDGDGWTQASPVASPPGRTDHALAYDQARGRVVLFGGWWWTQAASYNVLYDTWLWDGTAWTEQFPQANPPPRLQHAMAYDAGRGRVVLFGGAASTSSYGGTYADTWEWDGSSWILRLPASSPPKLAAHGLASDAARGRVVLYGGVSGSNVSVFISSATWEWDGTTWSRLSPPVDPGPRLAHCLAWDAARARVVLRGTDPSGVPDTWHWDGASWTQRDLGDVSPERYFHALAHDTARGKTLMFGGAGTVGAETWEWDGSSWSRRHPATSPPQRYNFGMAYDSWRARIVLFGGYYDQNGANRVYYGDTWEWDGTNWAQATPAASPPPRAGSSLCFDIARGRTVLFGGNPPSGYLNDTWEWDGVSWTQRNPVTSPAPRIGPLAYDALRARVVLFGGGGVGTRFGDTWEWDGTSWLQRTPATSPSARMQHATAYDVQRGRTIVFGGFPVTGGSSAETWEWDGITWTSVTTSEVPAARYDHALAYDATHGCTVLFGGLPDGGRGHTWLYADQSRRPAATLARFGTSCGGSSGAPLLTGGVPFLGNPAFVLDVVSALGGKPCAIGLSATAGSLGLGSCTLWIGSPWITLPCASNQGGFATVSLGIPDSASLSGANVYAQGFVQDPLGGYASLAFTAGLKIGLGR